MASLGDAYSLGNHRARLAQYLRGITFSSGTVAGRIIEERGAAEYVRDPTRPGLVLWGCEALGGDADEALPVAASFDLFDRFLMLHDELTKESAAIVARWGLGQSLNAGDALYALAFRTLASDVVSAPRRLETARLVGRAVLEAIEAREPGEGEAALSGAALEAGAVIAGASPEIARAFCGAGRLLAADTPRAIAMLRPYVAREAVDALV